MNEIECKSLLIKKECLLKKHTLAGKANADLLDWDSTTWRTNNTELMNMTSDQYVLIFTKAKNTKIQNFYALHQVLSTTPSKQAVHVS